MIRRGWWLWSGTRVLALLALVTFETGNFSDLNYYLASFRDFGSTGWSGTMAEYPLPAVAFLGAPYALLHAVGADGWAPVAWATIMLLVDLAVMSMVMRRRSAPAVLLWLVAVPALGPLVYCRFDLLTGFLVALAIARAHRSPLASGVYAGMATGLKYSPVLVVPALLAGRAGRRAVLAGVVVSGVVLAGITVALGGVDRLFTPLRYQSDRGLQIESVWASVVMVGRALAPSHYRVWFAESKSWEIAGPGADLFLALSTVVTVVLVLLLCWLWLRAWRIGTDSPERLVWLSLAATVAFIVGSKVLSPQYLAWLLPPAIVGVALLSGPDRSRLVRWSWLLLLACALSHVVWPLGYGPLMNRMWGTPLMTLVLVARNVVLLVLAYLAFVEAFRVTHREPASSRGLAP